MGGEFFEVNTVDATCHKYYVIYNIDSDRIIMSDFVLTEKHRGADQTQVDRLTN